MNKILETKKLSAGYGALRVLHEIDFSIAEGERIAIVGLNGHGKTTLFRSLTHLVGWQQGSILLNGEEIGGRRALGAGRKTPSIIHAGIAMSPQGDAIFPGLTVDQHLDCGAYKKESWKNRESKKQQIYEIFPPLLDLKKSLVGKISGGERRMLSVGRMLMEEAKLYLIDEPSLGLAPKISESVIKALLMVDIKNSAMIIAEQNVSLLKGKVDRMVGMHAGRIRGDVGHISLG